MRTLLINLAALLLLVACGQRADGPSDAILFDATRDYPEKQLLLDEVADITYVPLSNETDSALLIS